VTVLAIEDLRYLVGGWGISLLVVGGYALRLVLRGRKLTGRVPPEERRWT
jgi:hypothetical protein